MTRALRPIALLLVVIALVAGCGASAREKTLRAAVVSVNAARDGFIAFDLNHQRAILAAHTEREKYDAAIAAYRSKREPVVEAFVVAYRAIGVAAVLVDDDASLGAVGEAVSKLLKAIEDFKAGAK